MKVVGLGTSIPRVTRIRIMKLNAVTIEENHISFFSFFFIIGIR